MTDFTRAQFIRTGTKGGLALVAGGSVLAATSPIALGQTADDAAVAKLAATAELLAIDFYTRAIKSRKFKGNSAKYLKAALKNEKDHYAALAALLGSDAPKDLEFKYSASQFKSVTNVIKTGIVLETAFVGAYLGQLNNLSTPELRLVAGQIAANEAAHLGFLSGAVGKGVKSLPATITAMQASDAVGGFIKA